MTEEHGPVHRNLAWDQFQDTAGAHPGGPGRGQGELFSGASYERAKLPGEMSQDEWVEHHGSQVTYHGSFRDDWAKAPVIHAGTIGQASDRLHSAAGQIQRSQMMRESYYAGESINHDSWEPGDEDPEPQEHTGRMHAIRMHKEPTERAYDDEAANTAHYLLLRHKGHEDWEVPGSVTDTMRHSLRRRDQSADEYKTPSKAERSPLIGDALEQLGSGTPLRYKNDAESNQAIDPPETKQHSFAILRGGHSTWDQDVIAAGSRASGLAENYARQRMAQRSTGSVAFPSIHEKASRFMQHQLPGMPDEVKRGPTLIGGSSRETLSKIQFTTQPESEFY